MGSGRGWLAGGLVVYVLLHACVTYNVFSGTLNVTARHLVVGVSQTLQRWTEGATYVRQGNHHVGHWPTF